jgi:hypothetical protein
MTVYSAGYERKGWKNPTGWVILARELELISNSGGNGVKSLLVI